MPSNCATTAVASPESENTTDVITVMPNPFNSHINIVINDASYINKGEFKLYNSFGVQLMTTVVSKQLTVAETANLPSGIYFFNVISNDKIIQSGKLISEQ